MGYVDEFSVSDTANDITPALPKERIPALQSSEEEQGLIFMSFL